MSDDDLEFYIEGDCQVQDLEGDEIIMFAGTAWRIDSICETSGGGYWLRCKFGDRRLDVELPFGQPLKVLRPDR
jgi:hypothetical protein